MIPPRLEHTVAQIAPVPGPVSFAPMMGYTHVFYRTWMQLYCPSLYLYTEMLPAGALAHAPHKADRFLTGWTEKVTVQLGGSVPAELSGACRLVHAYGFPGIDLNVGCPSARVQSGAFGACLMKEPARVAALWRAMQDVSTVPVSVKTRVGVDTLSSFAFLCDYIGELVHAGCRRITLHARLALLNLDTKANRSIPPLEYEKVYGIKRMFPHVHITLNGGVADVEAIARHLQQVDAVMLGRALLADSRWVWRWFLDHGHSVATESGIIGRYREACQHWLAATGGNWRRPNALVNQPLMALLHTVPGAKQQRARLQAAGTWEAWEAIVQENAALHGWFSH